MFGFSTSQIKHGQAGNDSTIHKNAEIVARYTLWTVLCGVLSSIPVIQLRVGRVSDVETTESLNVLCTAPVSKKFRLHLLFSYGRAV